MNGPLCYRATLLVYYGEQRHGVSIHLMVTQLDNGMFTYVCYWLAMERAISAVAWLISGCVSVLCSREAD